MNFPSNTILMAQPKKSTKSKGSTQSRVQKSITQFLNAVALKIYPKR
jgi:hypothetical protein